MVHCSYCPVILPWAFPILLWSLVFPASAQQQPALPIESLAVFDTKGKVLVRSPKGSTKRINTTEATILNPGDTVQIETEGSAVASYPGGGSLILEESTNLKIPEPPKRRDDNPSHSLELLKGQLFFSFEPAEKRRDQKAPVFRLKTPTLILSVKGTKFFAFVEPDGSERVGVHEGSIAVSTKRNGEAVEVQLARNRVVVIGPDGAANMRAMTADESRWEDRYDRKKLSWQSMVPPQNSEPFWVGAKLITSTSQGGTGTAAKNLGLVVEEIESPWPGKAAQVRFTKLPDVENVEMALQTNIGPGLPRVAEFYVRGIGIKEADRVISQLSYRRGAGRTTAIDLSSGDWIRFTLPIPDFEQYTDRPEGRREATIGFEISLTSENLLPGLKEYAIQMVEGSILYSDN